MGRKEIYAALEIADHEVRLVVQLETPARLAGLQDTGTSRERVLSNTGSTSCLIAEAEQKSGHFIRHPRELYCFQLLS